MPLGVHILGPGYGESSIGSVNGFSLELYDSACSAGATVAVLTPFARSRSPSRPSRSDGTDLPATRGPTRTAASAAQ